MKHLPGLSLHTILLACALTHVGCGPSSESSRPQPVVNPYAVSALTTPLQQTDLAGTWFGSWITTSVPPDLLLFAPNSGPLQVTFDASGTLTSLEHDGQNTWTLTTGVGDATRGALTMTADNPYALYDPEVITYSGNYQVLASGEQVLRGVWTDADGVGGTYELFRLAPLAQPLDRSELSGTWTGDYTPYGVGTSQPVSLTIDASQPASSQTPVITAATFAGQQLDPARGWDHAYVLDAQHGVVELSFYTDRMFGQQNERIHVYLVLDDARRVVRAFATEFQAAEGGLVTLTKQ